MPPGLSVEGVRLYPALQALHFVGHSATMAYRMYIDVVQTLDSTPELRKTYDQRSSSLSAVKNCSVL